MPLYGGATSVIRCSRAVFSHLRAQKGANMSSFYLHVRFLSRVINLVLPRLPPRAPDLAHCRPMQSEDKLSSRILPFEHAK